jgi:hypothetical protein
MKTVVLILASFVMLSLTNTKIDNDKVIVWTPERKLTFNDYLKPVPKWVTWEGAATTVTISSRQEPRDGKTWIITEALFNKDSSWVKPELKNDTVILRHERLHFDIAELYARIIRKYFVLNTGYYHNTPELGKMMTLLVSGNRDLMESENIRYDIESNHGLDRDKQHQWEADVAKRMKELEEYK